MFGRETSLWKMKRAARAGDADAAFEVGVAYLNGIGTEKNIDKAAEFLKMGAEAGSPDAALTLGNMLQAGYVCGKNYRVCDPDAAFKLFGIAAEGGLAAGFYRMGLMYRDGLSVPQDAAKALELFIKASEKGFDPASLALYYMYREGDGTEPDSEKALVYLRMAAEAGNEEAINRLEENPE
jgi:TPR repeat protein